MKPGTEEGWCDVVSEKKCSLGGIRVSLWSLNRKRLRWELWAVQVLAILIYYYFEQFLVIIDLQFCFVESQMFIAFWTRMCDILQ